ncbi:MAG: hypothetical protein CO186_00920 [Zetaproteobacteria bacterium CG_4_9_14_3_um_filter_49_83]|nr:MAG: hypothetical protein COW62_13495 [Zetaproteobacteria bacterium CG17_big_fil_post_rev_8_21_14_2_50_50_13]PIV30643.1 MAG: hypothetical protein COS35_05670 [Zetaproteobacteria bacterium CG02_land_8_20_14_3_00_50_9]PIY56028.1 MAG: hypothetical protein COZ00_06780 [Zetaproteobacteria bacterium CG_4_10_14_0_8_um_filter_49_80]PJA36295.1 MAG: hypothetical protein CO186_00920 [Zetaproteobacteria bacterium CG_4_9_14_3_um_filter_49_83]
MQDQDITQSSEMSRYSYLFLSLMLAFPVFLWPLWLVIGFTPEFGVDIVEYWLIASGIVLVSAAVADSVLTGTSSTFSSVGNGAWILLATSVFAYVLRHHESAWLLAAVFALHAGRSAYMIWQGKPCWWSWMAWSRDVLLALVMFVWLSLWPVVI